MTTDILSDHDQGQRFASDASVAGNALDLAALVLRPWASLKLTVVLLVLAIYLIFVGTLAQAKMDMWEVISLYFRSWLSWIDVAVLFPPSWFPNAPEWLMRTVYTASFSGLGLAAAFACSLWRSGSWEWRITLGAAAVLALAQAVLTAVKGGFWFPGGATIGTLLAVNLLATQVVRFMIQARGWRLLAGLAIIAAGALTTWVVISSGHNPEGFQAVPVFSWAALWLSCKLALTGLAIVNLVMLAVMFVQSRQRIIELVLMSVSVVLLTLLSVWLWWAGEGAYLGDAGMRILWQLIQGGLAAAVVLAGCVLLFQRRGGMVLIHIGLALLMLSEVYVSFFAVEERLIIPEGETVNFAQDIRETELAIVDPDFSATEEDVLAIPRLRLLRSLERGEPIQDSALPFVVQVTAYLKNSDLRRVESGEKNPATAGTGLRAMAEDVRPGSGADSSGQVDMASAYVTLTGKGDGKPIGTYLVSQRLRLPERVSVGGKAYYLALRFKHTYKPYSMHLVDVRRDDYIGTSTAKNYSSDVRLIAPQHNIDRQVRIWMNNPLRYAGETFYQSGHQVDPETGVEVTTLQVVTNTGWMIPYVACMFVWFGMQAHFSVMLLRFLTRRDVELLAYRGEDVVIATPVTPATATGARRRKHGRQRDGESEPRAATGRGGVIFPAAVVLVFAGWLAGQARLPRTADDEFDFAAFASLPVVDQGRIKPIDTLARTVLAKMSDRETFRDADGKSQPAVRWLLDVVTKPSVAEEHRVFRIQNLDVLETLGLQRRQGFRYSLGEIRGEPGRLEEFDKQLRAAGQAGAAGMDVYRRNLVDLNNRFRAYLHLANAFQPWPLPPFPSEKESQSDRQAALSGWIARVNSLGNEAERELDAMQAPLAVPRLSPADQGQKPWQAYATASIRDYLQKDQATQAWKAIFDAYGKGQAKKFNLEVAKYRDLLAASPPDEYVPRKVRIEAYMNSFGALTFCVALYWTAFVLAAGAWLGWSRSLNRAAFWLVFLAFCVHSAAIVGRMYISGRPPVTNLYSSAVFISWCFALAGLVLEAIFRLGVCNVVAGIGGALTLMIAQALGRGSDTYTVMQAVLDTQFWLATHVVIIAMGYAATFLAGLLGIIYIAKGLLTRSLSSPEERRLMSRLIYGVVCFAALFSFVGTVLGGLWADDSWGRFWGWDPKENGALIIVLWNALILHALWDNLIRDRGLAVLAVVGNIMTAWSWFGVNELGVGLHAYGSSTGPVLLILSVAVAIHLAIIAAGCLPLSWWLSFRSSQPGAG